MKRPVQSFKGIVVVIHSDFRQQIYRLHRINCYQKKGVYAVKVYWNDEIYYGMTNIGVKPTFSKHAQELSVETHILDFTETIYGEQLVVEWIQHIRSEKKFSGIDEIVAQLKKDEANVRKLFQIER